MILLLSTSILIKHDIIFSFFDPLMYVSAYSKRVNVQNDCWLLLPLSSRD